MASQVDGDLSKIQTGPCEVTFGGDSVGHTMEGVKFSVKPDIRKRTVDEYGTMRADMIYQGEDIEVTTTLAEKTMAVLRIVYMWGYEVSGVRQGFGRLPGTKGSDLAQELRLHPLDIAGTSEDVVFHKACVMSTAEVQFGVITADRVFGVTFACLIDETKTEAQGLLGYIGGPA